MYIFNHIPKCGGLSYRALFEEALGKARVEHISINLEEEYQPDPNEYRQYTMLMGHFGVRWNEIGGPGSRWMTARAAALAPKNAGAAVFDLEHEVERVVGQPVWKTLGPLDGRGSSVVGFLDAELGQLGRAANAIEIHVHEIDAPGMLIDQCEGGARDMAFGGHA